MGARNMLCQIPRPISRGLPGSFAIASSAFLKRPAFSDAVFPRNFVSHCPLAARPFSLSGSFSISSPGPVPISNPGDVDPSVRSVDEWSESKVPRAALGSPAAQKTKNRQKSKARKQTRTRNRTTKRARPASPATNNAKANKRGKCACRHPNKASSFKASKGKAPKASKSRCCCCCDRANHPRTKGNHRHHRHVAKKARHKPCHKRNTRRHRRGHSTVKRRSKRLTAKDVQEGLFAPLLGSLDDPEREEAASARTINPYRMYKEFIRRSISSGTTAFLPSPAWLGRTRSAAPSVGRHLMARMRWLGKRKAGEGGERAPQAEATRSAPAQAKGKVVKRSPPSSRGGSARPRKDSAMAQLSVTPSPGAGLCPGTGLCSRSGSGLFPCTGSSICPFPCPSAGLCSCSAAGLCPCSGSGLCVDPELCAGPRLCTAQGMCTCSGSGLSIGSGPNLSVGAGSGASLGAGSGVSVGPGPGVGAGSGVSVGPGPGVGAASGSGSNVAPAPGSGLTHMERLRLWSPVVRRITLVARPDTSPAAAHLHH